jgi:hypothetical protein
MGNMLKWSAGFSNFSLRLWWFVAGIAILPFLAGCISVPKPPPQFPAWTPSNHKSAEQNISGCYQDTGLGYTTDGKCLGKFSLTSVLQRPDPSPATNNDVVVVVGPENRRLEIQTWRENQLVSTIHRTYSKAMTSSDCKSEYNNYDEFVFLPLIMNTEAAGFILPLMFENADSIDFLRKAENGSLIVYDYHCDSGYIFFVPFHHNHSQWYRFPPVARAPGNATNTPAGSRH